MSTRRILDVGQCGVDGPRIGRFLWQHLQAKVDRAETCQQAVELAGREKYGLVLVNRVLNADRSPGMEVIRALKEADPGIKVMLVSDYPEAQEEAMALGAMKGFGKSELETEETERLIEEALDQK